MKVHILNKLSDKPWGGGNQFLKALKLYLESKNHYETDISKCDFVLFNSFPLYEDIYFTIKLFKLKSDNPNLKFIHRVDGPISKVRSNIYSYNYDCVIQKLNYFIADATIYQSAWSKKQCLKLGLSDEKYSDIIINSCDEKIFFKRKQKNVNKKISIIATSWSSNWLKGFDIYRYLDQNLDFDKYSFTFVGNSPMKFYNTKIINPLKSKDLALELSKHDIYITASVDDPCSNALIEGVNCGLTPVVRNSGGHPEIVSNKGYLFNNESDVLNAIYCATKNLKSVKFRYFEDTGKKYIKFFKKCQTLKNDFTNFKYTDIFYIYYKIFLSRYYEPFDKNLVDKLPYNLRSFLKKRFYTTSKYKNFDKFSIKTESDVSFILKNIPYFINKLSNMGRFSKFTISGDLHPRQLLSTSVFKLKLSNLIDHNFENDTLINHILSFQKEDGMIFDHLLFKNSKIRNIRSLISSQNKDFYNAIIRAESRQSFAVLRTNLTTFDNIKPFSINSFIDYKTFTKNLNWSNPWSAVSHFSHLLFFLKTHHLLFNDVNVNYNLIISDAIKFVNDEFLLSDGSWGNNKNICNIQKVNVAMKMMTALDSVGKVSIPNPNGLIDLCLGSISSSHACDNFNIICVLYHCSKITNYRLDEIQSFVLRKMNDYSKYYCLDSCGFSFYHNKSQDKLYGTRISLGLNEADIHGTLMFTWGISLCTSILNWSVNRKFNHIIT